MFRPGILVLLLLLGWVATWLSLGLLNGSPTLLLHPGSSDRLRITYLVMLYAWLLLATAFCWKRWGPSRPFGSARFSRSLAYFLGFFAAGLGLLAVQRSLLWGLGWWLPPSALNPQLVLIAVLTSPLLAVAEELVFRGYLYGVAREEFGEGPALVGVNLFFALLHLFRPGGLMFKLAYGFGLWLAGVVLTLALRRTGRLSAPMGLHASWILAGVIDPPGKVVPSLVAGLRGDPAAGLIGWGFLIFMMLGLSGPARGQSSVKP